MARVVRLKPKYKNFLPGLVDEDGYMVLPENMNKYKVFSARIAEMITRRLDSKSAMKGTIQ